MSSLIEKWKKEQEERNEFMLKRIFESDYAKEWIKNRQENIKDETEFYKRELTEEEWKSNLVSEFLEQDLKDIVAVLPEVWQEIQEQVKDELEAVLCEPGKLEEYIGLGFGKSHLDVPFSLEEYLNKLDRELQKTLKA